MLKGNRIIREWRFLSHCNFYSVHWYFQYDKWKLKEFLNEQKTTNNTVGAFFLRKNELYSRVMYHFAILHIEFEARTTFTRIYIQDIRRFHPFKSLLATFLFAFIAWLRILSLSFGVKKFKIGLRASTLTFSYFES